MNEVVREVPLPGDRALRIVRGDLTLERVDAVVNAANGELQHGGGVAAALARAAGPALQRHSDAWVRERGPVPTGKVAVTLAGKLPARAVIHAVGPVWRGGEDEEDAKLESAVRASLAAATAEGFRSIAFPAISAGIFGFPKERCARLMLGAIRAYPRAPPEEVRIVLRDGDVLDAFLAAL